MRAELSVKKRIVNPREERIHRYRADWSFERLSVLIAEGDTVLNLGAGDCRLDQRLARDHKCEMVSLDVDNYNETDMPLMLYDGLHIPFPDNSFDVVLLIFSLHHAKDPGAVLREAKRVCRNKIIAFEDSVVNIFDRLIFRGFHWFLKRSQGFPLPHHEWSPDRWSRLATELGLIEETQKPLGRTFGYLASRHIAYVWAKPGSGRSSPVSLHEQG